MLAYSDSQICIFWDGFPLHDIHSSVVWSSPCFMAALAVSPAWAPFSATPRRHSLPTGCLRPFLLPRHSSVSPAWGFPSSSLCFGLSLGLSRCCMSSCSPSTVGDASLTAREVPLCYSGYLYVGCLHGLPSPQPHPQSSTTWSRPRPWFLLILPCSQAGIPCRKALGLVLPPSTALGWAS